MNPEIKASVRVTGLRRVASIEAARKRVRDGEVYFIRRHGGYFRPGAHGYTDHIAAAGLFSPKDARRYLEVEGLSVVPFSALRREVAAEAKDYAQRAAMLRKMLQNPAALAA